MYRPSEQSAIRYWGVLLVFSRPNFPAVYFHFFRIPALANQPSSTARNDGVNSSLWGKIWSFEK